MIEIVHFKNRFGKNVAVVFETGDNYSTPAGKEYAQRYAAGLEPPFYPLPTDERWMKDLIRLLRR